MIYCAYNLVFNYNPVCTQRRFNVETASFQRYARCIDVETTFCAYTFCAYTFCVRTGGALYAHYSNSS